MVGTIFSRAGLNPADIEAHKKTINKYFVWK
jgi:hypothetical protein